MINSWVILEVKFGIISVGSCEWNNFDLNVFILISHEQVLCDKMIQT